MDQVPASAHVRFSCSVDRSAGPFEPPFEQPLAAILSKHLEVFISPDLFTDEWFALNLCWRALFLKRRDVGSRSQHLPNSWSWSKRWGPADFSLECES